MINEPQQPSTPEPRPLNFMQRCVGIFASPKRTFEDIVRRPDWVVPMLIVALVTVLLTQISLPSILADAERQMEKVMDRQNLSAEQAERAAQMGLAYAKGFSAVMAGLTVAIGAFVAAAILLFAGNIVLAGKGTYQQLLGVWMWSSLVDLLGYALRVPLALQQLTMRIYFGPAVLFPPETEPSALFRLAGALDVFSLWKVVLLALGFSAVYRFNLGKSFLTVGGLYALLVASGMAFAGVFGR